MTSSNGNIFRVTGPLWGNPPVTGGFPSQRPVTRIFDVFFDLPLNKRFSKQLRSRWFETPLRSYAHYYVDVMIPIQHKEGCFLTHWTLGDLVRILDEQYLNTFNDWYLKYFLWNWPSGESQKISLMVINICSSNGLLPVNSDLCRGSYCVTRPQWEKA